jgi:hypothetical protein
LFTCNLIGQVQTMPAIDWTVADKYFDNRQVKLRLETKVPENWMIATENNELIPRLEFKLENVDSFSIQNIKIKQTKGVRLAVQKLQEIFGGRVETTEGAIEFEVEINFERQIATKNLLGWLSFFCLNSEMAFPPIEQKFEIFLND